MPKAVIVIVLITLLSLTAAGVRWLAGASSTGRPPTAGSVLAEPDDDPGTEPERTGVAADAEGECATGCSVGNHPVEELTPSEYEMLLLDLARGTEEERAVALETLLFHGAQVRSLAESTGFDPLERDRAKALRRELERTHARVWLRLVDERGVVRASVDGSRMPLGRKEHLHATSSRDLEPPEISGTVHRTGLHHLWTRI